MVILSTAYQPTIEKVIDLVGKNPANPRFLAEFHLNRFECDTPLQIFVWSPLESFGVTAACKKHNCPLYGSDWTSDVTHENSGRNPRLIYCLFYNIILIQRYYRCSNKGDKCLMSSTSKDFMELLHPTIANNFPYKLYCRSAFSYKLIDFIFEMVANGSSFNSIANNIASIKAANFKSKSGLGSPLMQFPSPSRLETLFLDIFQTRKKTYQFAMDKVVPECVISVDHTFKIGKNIGGFRKVDGKFIKDEKKLFIVLDEYLRVASWKLTKTTSQDEIRDVIRKLSEKCKEVFMILTDNCCQDKNLYLQFFLGILVKLDLFHGIQRVTNTIPANKFSTERSKFINDFSLVFRERGDVGKAREKPTPSKDVILNNIDSFLRMNKTFIGNLSNKDEFMKQVELLKKHVEKGCLSDIGVGHGTEGNESLHRLLNRSCLRGATVIGPELMESVLTVIFYHYNAKIGGIPHKCNSSIVPVFPPECVSIHDESPPTSQQSREEQNLPSTAQQIRGRSSIIDNPSPEPSPKEICSQNLQKVLHKALSQIQDVSKTLLKIQEMSKLRGFSPQEILRKEGMSNNITSNADINFLNFNLSAFGLEACKPIDE
ncbi:uncharacterized protein, partial [Clytia hemisphaerica]|uniref:uncharacterized protein n=1 Tax=Clytia hemisphaerica TaxID=252671 RepID=UPI0034D5D85C